MLSCAPACSSEPPKLTHHASLAVTDPNQLSDVIDRRSERHCLAGHGGRPMRPPVTRRVGVIHEDDDVAFSPPKGMGLLCTWAVCRQACKPLTSADL